MAHEVENMMYVGETPWHGLGVAIPKGRKVNIEEAIVAAGLNWIVERRPVFTEYRSELGLKIEVPNCFAICRNFDDSVLGVVGPDYTPLQNMEAFTWFQPFLDAGEATIETAGSLKAGKTVWVLAKISKGESSVHSKDEIHHYLLLSNSHDGATAVRVGFTPVRVVCNNTLCLAHESKASKLLRVRHTSRLHDNLEAVREIMSLARREFRATVKQYGLLASKGIDKKDLETYVRKVFELPDDKGGKELIPLVTYLFEEGRGAKEAGATYWGAYNAINGYLNYFRGKTQDNTLKSLWFGDSGEVNKKALNVAMKMAAA